MDFKKLKKGDKLILKRKMKLSSEYEKLKKGSEVEIISTDVIQHEYPYYVQFSNGYKMHMSAYELRYYTKLKK